MQMIDRPPKVQVLVCTNQRPADSELPCCANSGGEAVYERLHRATLERGWGHDVYVTRTGCMAWCHPQGVTVVVQPLGLWLHRVSLAEAERLIAEVLAPLLADETHDEPSA